MATGQPRNRGLIPGICDGVPSLPVSSDGLCDNGSVACVQSGRCMNLIAHPASAEVKNAFKPPHTILAHTGANFYVKIFYILALIYDCVNGSLPSSDSMGLPGHIEWYHNISFLYLVANVLVTANTDVYVCICCLFVCFPAVTTHRGCIFTAR
jgi:hypothetical protein